MNRSDRNPPGHATACCPAAAPTGLQVVIALGRGGYGSAAQIELNALCQRLRQALPRAHVAAAYVDRASPSLPDALDACLQACPEAAQITVCPMFVPVDPALLRWLEKVVQRWRHRQPDPGALPRIAFAPPLGELDGLADLLARQLEQAPEWPDVTQTTPQRWQTDPIAWSKVPPHRHQVLVCMGPRCCALGANALWSQLSQAMRDNATLRNSVSALQTSCHCPCNLGPLMIVYPQGVWYGRLDATAVEQIIDQHLGQGRVVSEYVVHGPIKPGNGS